MPSKRWILPPPPREESQDLASALKVSPFVAELLLARGVHHPAAGQRFMEPDLQHLHDPFLLPDMRQAVDRLHRAVQSGEKILVHGDYDVDGVCAAALLTRVLTRLKANVEPFVPHRKVEGYDLRPETVARAAQAGVKLIVTADCGIVAFEAAAEARRLGVDLIITDHHEPDLEGQLPDALAVVNPKRPESDYPFEELCGTAVAFKLACALVEEMGIKSSAFQTAYLDLVALATCADCMPLVDENRVFVKAGLDTLRKTNKAGLLALMRVAAVTPANLTARSLGFGLGPRINAIGRLDAAEHALRLLITQDEAEARHLAERLDAANRERQQHQETILQEAIRQSQRFVDDRILVLASPKWHMGVIGIVASKLVEALCRPTVMIAIDEESGTARGSCRSVDGFDIFGALDACREHLIRCGGHQAAAGFDIDPANLGALREALQEVAASELDDELLQPHVRIDAVVPVTALNLRLAEELSRLEPYGHGNHEPVFLTRGLPVLEQRRIQSKSSGGADHLKLRLQHPENARGLDALFWRHWSRNEECPPQSLVDACFTVEVNTYNGQRNLQLSLQDFGSSGA